MDLDADKARLSSSTVLGYPYVGSAYFFVNVITIKILIVMKFSCDDLEAFDSSV